MPLPLTPLSITTMEIVDNLFIIAVPGALAAGLGDGLFWWSLILSLVIAFVVTVPVNAQTRTWSYRQSQAPAIRTANRLPSRATP